MPEPPLLEPVWAQKPTASEISLMCRRVVLDRVALPAEPFSEFLGQLRLARRKGGAYLEAFEVSPDNVFDWFASRNRLCESELINLLVVHPTIREALPELAIPNSKVDTGLGLSGPFILDGRFAHELHEGGAYWSATGDGKNAKTLALSVCEAMFGWRYGEVTLLESGAAWTPWFKGIAWDLTEVLFDKRLRKLWIFAVTDTD